MDFTRILGILNDESINKEEVFRLVHQVKNSDLTDEANLRDIIKKSQ